MAAAEHLIEHDEILRPVVQHVGLCTIEPHENYYQELVESIVGQQLSIKAAAAINRRFLILFDGTFPSPEQILQKSIEELKTAGLSGAKARYVQDLAQHVVDGRIRFDRLDKQSNEEIIQELTTVKGIGEWTVHMFLMFAMGRMDILALGDLGVRTGIMKLYGLEQLPTPKEVQEIASHNHWSPYESIACWYIWQSLK